MITNSLVCLWNNLDEGLLNARVVPMQMLVGDPYRL